VNDGQRTEQQTTAQDLAGITDRGLSLAREGHTKEAIALLTRASEGGYAAATFGLGLVADSQGSADEASAWYERAAEQGSSEAMFNLGVEAADRGDESTAQRWYETAAKSGHTGAMESLAAIALDRDDLASAERWYRQAVESGDLELAYNLALVLQEQGKQEQAVRALWRAATGRDPRAMVLLGDAARRTEKPEQAEYWYRAGAALHHGPALFGLGLTLADRADYAGAEKAMVEAAEAGDGRAMGTLGALAESHKQTKEALGWYERGAASGDQESIDALRRLGGTDIVI
jgi:TPR repeat protein